MNIYPSAVLWVDLFILLFLLPFDVFALVRWFLLHRTKIIWLIRDNRQQPLPLLYNIEVYRASLVLAWWTLARTIGYWPFWTASVICCMLSILYAKLPILTIKNLLRSLIFIKLEFDYCLYSKYSQKALKIRKKIKLKRLIMFFNCNIYISYKICKHIIFSSS